MAIDTGKRHSDHVLAVLRDGSAPARSALAASWRRSMTVHGLNPDTAAPPETVTDVRLRDAREGMGPLLSAAQGALDRLYHAVGGTGCCVLLTDRNGVAVDRRGAVADDAMFHAWRLWPGAVWSEASEGTNGIGTCLAEKRAVTIHRDQHFHTRNIGLSCIDAPVFDHRGELAGALDVSSAKGDITEGFMGLIFAAVQDAARAIEAQAFREAFPQARIMLAPSGDGSALLALDRDDLVIGATRAARAAFGITDERIDGALPASEILHGEAPGADFAEAERGAIRRALASADGNVSAAARNLGVSRATLYRKMEKLGVV
ncbi:MAG TPA: helix-turn-helix domain-containing protein [Hyphomonadaceae bacterium]|nr:helix-turn-helix domain-containing protein [Hyphomonadaceae bacterium]